MSKLDFTNIQEYTFYDSEPMTQVQYLERRITYHLQCMDKAKKPHTRKRHKKRIRWFESKLKEAQLLDLIGGTHGKIQ